MNIRRWFIYKKLKALDEVDRLTTKQLTSEEMKESRRVIAKQFDDLLDTIQNYEDDLEKAKADIRRDNELIKMLCGKEA